MQDISSEKMEQYRQTFRKKVMLEEKRNAERRDKALETAKKAACLLKDEYGAKKVILFGSLSHNRYFDATSDIDIAVKGLDKNEYFRVVSKMIDLDHSIDIDLVIMEDASDGLLKTIIEEGKQL
jgi:uncharacterized protein